MVYGDKMYIFGGQHNTTTNNNDLYSFDFATATWKKEEYREKRGI